MGLTPVLQKFSDTDELGPEVESVALRLMLEQSRPQLESLNRHAHIVSYHDLKSNFTVFIIDLSHERNSYWKQVNRFIQLTGVDKVLRRKEEK